ncbi:hypothetical protein CEP45_08415 [Mergibacter septicus]|uniref:RNA-directed DNA polymerase n=1 Tax=Mergibacter septicus TaxID=221402 RepID=UPI001C75B57A|nr:RNA-directed DNA polymerase [Mergibacter septicus]QDJ13846.1 hypothetical protein CEP45_08415 [Mergibacter septicus]
MSWGQTNGIPQGSVLMDFIAELVLGYCDEILEEKLSERRIDNYFIIRYRDDYRVFTNSKEDAEFNSKRKLALKFLSKYYRGFNLNIIEYLPDKAFVFRKDHSSFDQFLTKYLEKN